MYSWNLQRLSHPREEGGWKQYALKGHEAGGVLSEGVLCILGPQEETAPAVPIFLAVCPEVTSKFLVLLLSLAIRLRMVTRGQAHRDFYQAEGFSHMGDKLWASIGDDIFWYPEVPEDMMEQLSQGTYWATSTELKGARGYVGYLDVQSPVYYELSP